MSRSARGRLIRTLLGAPAAVLVVLAGCGSDGSETPTACRGSAQEYLAALRAAPADARLGGETPISECLVPDQDPVEIAEVGAAMIAASTKLNARARRNPSGDATVQLGYLVGAAQQGAAESADVHTDLLRRLDAAARFTDTGDPPPASFERAFGEGYAAGQSTG